MAFDFPSSPSIGQASNGYTWDGVAWKLSYTGPVGPVRYDVAQGLTAVEQTQGRSNIYAAPFDALAYSGLQVNGAVEVSQERAHGVAITVPGWICDGWYVGKNGTMVISAQVAPAALFAPGFNACIYVTCSTAQPVMTAPDYLAISQYVEGFRLAKLGWGTVNAQPVTISFWCKHDKTGIFSVGIRNATYTRSYAATYTQNVSGALEYKTITIPGCTDGVWETTTAFGAAISFVGASGSNYIASSANVWTNSAAFAAPGQVNSADATVGAAMRFTGLTIMPGNVGPSSDRVPLILRPYDEEFRLCQRYWELGLSNMNYRSNNTIPNSIAYDTIRYTVPKRAVPTLSFNSWSYYNTVDATPACTPALYLASADQFTYTVTGLTNMKAWVYGGAWRADARYT